MKKILFVCTGNTCRSPMAAALMNKLLEERGIMQVIAESAGLAANEGGRASKNAVIAAGEAGADLSGHRARAVTRALIEGSDGIYAMSPGHRAALAAAYPAAAGRIKLLGSGIPDPYGGDINIYRRCRDDIIAALEGIIEGVAGDE
jgi:protein-tyrosine-phosphatase